MNERQHKISHKIHIKTENHQKNKKHQNQEKPKSEKHQIKRRYPMSFLIISLIAASVVGAVMFEGYVSI